MPAPVPKPLPAPPAPSVAVLVDTATSWGRDIIRGVHDFSSRHGWDLHVELRGPGDAAGLPRGWHGDGIIARIGTAALARRLHRPGLPVVNVSSIHLPGGAGFPCVRNDVEAAAQLAVDYFLARGFRHFAYLSLQGLEYVARQRAAYVKALSVAGLECAVHGVKPSVRGQAHRQDMAELGAWLRALPKPVALLTWSGGHEVLRVCQREGVRIPEEVALLSGADDDLLCGVSNIPVSGIPAASRQIGREAARLLHQLMQGKPAPQRPRKIKPLGVITRQSTDTLAIADRPLASAVAFIRSHLASPIQVNAVAAHAGLSRSVLERRFAEALAVSPAAYIAQLRLDLVRRLLAETELPIAEVAESAGFGSQEYMTYVFRTRLKTTPLRYRREVRGALN